MLIAALLAVGAAPVAAPVALPACRRDQLRMGIGPRDGVADFAPVSGAVISIGNLGPDCDLPGLPAVVLRDRRGLPLPATRRSPLGMHPGPVIAPVALPGGHRATFELSWPYCPSVGRCARVASVSVSLGSISLRAPARGSPSTAPAGPFQFDQPPGRVAEGMAADLE